MRTSIIGVKEIVVEKSLYPREKVSERKVKEYREAIQRGDKFPDLFIGLFKGKNYLVDGRHRLEAYKSLGEKFVNCEVKTNFPNFEAMFISAVRANNRHGYPLTNTDKLRIADMMRKMKFAVEDISKLTGIKLHKLDRIFVDKLSRISIAEKVKSGEIPEKVTEKPSRKRTLKLKLKNKNKK